MSYEKLGFVKGQKLKADHLNHMEEGIANAGGAGAGIEYYTGEIHSSIVEFDWGNDTLKYQHFTLLDLTLDELRQNYCKVELGVRLSSDTNMPAGAEYSWIIDASTYSSYSSEYNNNVRPAGYISTNTYDSLVLPKANIANSYSVDVDENNLVSFSIDMKDDKATVTLASPQVLYVRLYPRA